MRHPFPLQWPPGCDRTPARDRIPSRFITGMFRAVSSLRTELERLGAENVVITSDLATRANGTPYGSAGDPGIAVWFIWDAAERVISCDRWVSAAENIRAIALTIEALRGMDRWGASSVLVRAFHGFLALPPGPSAPGPVPWRDTLGVYSQGDADTVLRNARTRYRTLIRTAHPDAGGTLEATESLNSAIDAAERELSPPTTETQ